MRTIALALVLVSSVSLAQQPDPAPRSPNPRVQNVDFEGTKITGEQDVPLGRIYLVPPKAKFGSMIRVRMNFDDKLAESVHEM